MKQFKIKNNPIGTLNDTPSEIKYQAIKWLARIGVAKSDIDFDYIRVEAWAEIEFVLDNKVYKFKSTKQKTFKQNLKAIEIFLHNRVVNIERGIEEFKTAFSGYAQLEDKSQEAYINPYSNLSEKEIKAMMKIYHPDMPNGDIKIFNMLNSALSVRRGGQAI